MADRDRRIRFRGGPPTLKQRSEGEPPTLVGHAAVFDTETVIMEHERYQFREVIRRGAFSRALRERQNVTANFNHDDDMLLGRSTSGTLRMREDETGLAVEIDLPPTTLGRDIEALVKRGDISGMSFAFIPARDGGEKLTVTSEGGVEVDRSEVLDVDLYDVAVVTSPAYEATDVALRFRAKAKAQKQRRDDAERQKTARRKRLESLTARVGGPNPGKAR